VLINCDRMLGVCRKVDNLPLSERQLLSPPKWEAVRRVLVPAFDALAHKDYHTAAEVSMQ